MISKDPNYSRGIYLLSSFLKILKESFVDLAFMYILIAYLVAGYLFLEHLT